MQHTTSTQGSFTTHHLRHPSTDASFSVCELGATVTSWKSGGAERLYVSPKALFDGTKPIRGGVPLVFPWFGKPEGRVTQHGFARNLRWTFVESGSSATLLQFRLEQSEKTREVWPHDFEALYSVSFVGDAALRTEMQVTNKGSAECAFDFLLHTYFAVEDIGKVQVHGLSGVQYEDKTLPAATGLQQSAEPSVTFAGEVDRTFKDAPDTLELLQGARKIIKVDKHNLKDAVVWNPWIEKAKGMADFVADEYTKMVCVEVGTVMAPVKLAGGATWKASQVMTAQ